MVEQSAGGWRTKTVWDMLDAVLGRQCRARPSGSSIACWPSSEQPVGILAQISASLRRLATATRLILQAEAAGRRIDASRRAPAGRRQTVRAEKGRAAASPSGPPPRRRQLHGWLLEADQQLKGDSAMPPRLVLERLLVRLAVTGQSVPRGVD